MRNLKLDHIGIVTDNIVATSEIYNKFGYTSGDVIIDEIQQVKISFLINGENKIELVEPLNEKSSVNKLLKKNGVSPYHLCYEVDNINETYDDLLEEGFIPLFRPVEAAAFNNRLICYMYNSNVGYIELVNKE